MNLQVLAQNVRRLRAARRYSQNALAEAAGISLPAIKKLEGGKAEPRMKTLQSIANALDVRLQELFYPVRALKTVRFRSNKRMQNRENILADIVRWIDDFSFLEETLDERQPYKFAAVEDRISVDDIIRAASLCRKILGLKPNEPIHDICGLLEHAGIKVYPISVASDGFFGLSVAEEDGGPAIVVNTWERIAVERWIFSAAHELGHLILHRDAYDVALREENSEEERQADLFAGYFLMPDDGFRKEWKEAAGLALVDRVFKIKRIFRVSYKAVLVRLLEQGVVDKSIWQRFNWAYQRRYGRKLAHKEEPMGFGTEPFHMARFDFFEDRLSRLTRSAVEEDKISLSRGAEILRLGIEDMQELVRDWGAVA